jgi:hypothetical protein
MNGKDVDGKGRGLIRSKIRQSLSPKPEITHQTGIINWPLSYDLLPALTDFPHSSPKDWREASNNFKY